jgi:methyl-accepting chemotaxis protein-1 (serine sensor receptor)
MKMDEVTQQNAALVEGASAAAQSMAGQAETLRGLVSVFRLNAADLGRVPRDVPPEKSEASTAVRRKPVPKATVSRNTRASRKHYRQRYPIGNRSGASAAITGASR